MLVDALGGLLGSVFVVVSLCFVGVVVAHHGTAILRIMTGVSGGDTARPGSRLLRHPPESTSSSFARVVALPALSVIAVIGAAVIALGAAVPTAPNVIGTASTVAVLLVGYLAAAMNVVGRHRRATVAFYVAVLLLLATAIAANIAHLALTTS
jgi:hypothetical protein